MKKYRLPLALTVNLALIALEIIATRMAYTSMGFTMLTYYTIDSNLLALIAAVFLAVFQIRELCGKGETPALAKTLKYISACCLTLTFIVALCVLTPMYSGENALENMMLKGEMLYHHLLCPLITLFSVILLDDARGLSKRLPLLAMIPTLIYAAVTLTLNILRKMEGPYPFLMIYKQPLHMTIIWFAAIIGGAFLITLLIYRFACGKHEKNEKLSA
ncbi:MAG: hypothetical protein PHI27_02905 [Eubacteriales bacterium]|nr:hypothetical protein [Eubacteriales bacterium]MDD3881184.1 hypothetical protein [Eubacteriales bacterium]MDD4511566.1 hypothetical protein [Eubacteriales bacterium]